MGECFTYAQQLYLATLPQRLPLTRGPCWPDVCLQCGAWQQYFCLPTRFFFFSEDQPLSLIRKLAVKLTVVVANEQ